MFQFEIVVPVCKKTNECTELSRFYSRDNPFEEDHTSLKTTTIVAGILNVEGYQRENAISVVPLHKSSKASQLVPIQLPNGKPLIMTVRWFYTRNWKKVTLL
jgi:hypothetical protein